MLNNLQAKTIYIVGPTASGKSAVSIELAKEFNAEILCADSQTVRRAMNIGTAKPTLDEQSGVVHHMLDIIDPYEPYSLSLFLEQSRATMRDIYSRRKNLIVVGGTGLYTDALYFEFSLPKLTDTDLGDMSTDDLQTIILEEDLPIPANDNNPRHLINTIKRGGVVGKKNKPDDSSIIVGINPGREVIIERINERIDQMFDRGFMDEVRGILEAYGEPPREFDAIGYRIAHRVTRGEITEQEARELFKIADRQYAKRQMSWYKRNQDIRWFSSPQEAKTFILEGL